IDVENLPSLPSSPRDNVGCTDGMVFKVPASVSHPNQYELPTIRFSNVQETPSRRKKVPLHSQTDTRESPVTIGTTFRGHINSQKEIQSQDISSSPDNIYRSLGWDDVDELA